MVQNSERLHLLGPGCWALGTIHPLPRNLSPLILSELILGGDLVSTWVAKPEVHAEVRVPRKTVRNSIVANDDNYALAA